MRPQVFDVKHLEATVLGRADHFPKVDELATGEDVTAHEQAGRIIPDALGACNSMVENLQRARSQPISASIPLP